MGNGVATFVACIAIALLMLLWYAEAVSTVFMSFP